MRILGISFYIDFPVVIAKDFISNGLTMSKNLQQMQSKEKKNNVLTCKKE